MKYAYYPGCNAAREGDAHGVSMMAVARALDLDLVEIDDWNCCGATEYLAQQKLVASAVVARNLALVDGECDTVTAPCSACYLNLRKADEQMGSFPEYGSKVNEALAAGGLHYEPGSLRIRHLLDVFYNDLGEDRIRAAVKNPLEGLSVAAYYGCQMMRPYNGFDDAEHPTKMEELFTWLGADPVDYPAKTCCCSGHMTQLSEPEAYELIRRLLQNAEDNGARMIACMCPMCQFNLDLYQGRVNNHFNTGFQIPVLFLTQLMGLAFGVSSDDLGLGREIVPAAPSLGKLLAEAR